MIFVSKEHFRKHHERLLALGLFKSFSAKFFMKALQRFTGIRSAITSIVVLKRVLSMRARRAIDDGFLVPRGGRGRGRGLAVAGSSPSSGVGESTATRRCIAKPPLASS
jgi:hypothetical protein